MAFKRVLAGMFSENDAVCMYSDRLGRQDFIRLFVCEHSVLMYSRLVRKSVFAHDGLVERRALTDYVVNGLARAVNLRCVNTRIKLGIHIGARAHSHYDFLEGSVAGALAESVYGAFNLPCTPEYAAERVCNRHSEIVMAVNGKYRFIGVRRVLYDVLYEVSHFSRRRVADGIGKIYRICAVIYRDFNDFTQKIGVASRCVFRRKFYV